RFEDKIVRGIVATDGSHWTEQRRFALKQLRDLGFGTKTMEARIQEAIHDFLDSLKPKEDKLKEEDPDLWEAFHGLNSVV
ncbi:unnamed protein product, partial [Allacma fusca]